MNVRDDREHEGFVGALRARRRQAGSRLLLAGVVAMVMSNLVGPPIAIGWLAAYAVITGLDWLLVERATRTGERMSTPRKALACLFLALSSAIFGALSIPLWMMGGPLGGVVAAFLLSASVLNVVSTTPGSRLALACSSAPHCLLMFSVPGFVAFFGGGQAYSEATLAGAAAFLTNAFVAWYALDGARSRAAEARESSERKRADAEAAVAAKSAFVATVSHELRTPISALTAGAAALEATHKSGPGRHEAALIADAARMMKTLLDDLLDQAKLDAGRLSVETVPFDLRRALAHAVRFWTAEARKKGLKLRVEGANTLPRGVVGDETRLRQILNNLFSNAIKFTAEGEVTLRLSGWSEADERVALVLQVVDTGRGMSREALNRLFRPFEQAEAMDANVLGGTGLGLSISRQLADLMGGTLTATSVEGRGSTFTLALTLPAAELDADAPARRGVSDATAPLHVLVVDDHDVNRRAIALMLQPLGIRVATAESGPAALETASEQAFDMILMDVRMPGMDGREAARRIRAGEGPNVFTPIVAVTADGEESDIANCRLAGMSGFVSKPIDPTRLIACIESAVTRPYPGALAGAAA